MSWDGVDEKRRGAERMGGERNRMEWEAEVKGFSGRGWDELSMGTRWQDALGMMEGCRWVREGAACFNGKLCSPAHF